VIRRVAETAQESADAGAGIPAISEAVCDSAREAVALTPTMLPVLREAGVVDAGGQGLYVILEGIRSYLDGRDVASVVVHTPAPVGSNASVGAVSREFLEATDELQYGYCTQFLIAGQDMDPTSVREAMTILGRSTVVVGDESMVKVHLHTEDPGPALSRAVALGTLSQVKIQNMDEQHREYSDTRRQETAASPTEVATGPIAVVAVALGRGLEDVFLELGAAKVLAGGDTMNPSVQEIVDAVQSVPSESVLFLPNNRNIIPAAKQAADTSDKSMALVPTTSIPQGIAAMLEFNPAIDLDENASSMERRLSSVRTGEICRAVRPVSLGGVSVAEGQLIGMLERKLVVAGDESTDVLISLLREADVSDGELVTIYWGEHLTQYDALAAQQRVSDAFPAAEVEVVEGGQPHYQYIVSVE
jgi:DAK2 domain fusion protein YloV